VTTNRGRIWYKKGHNFDRMRDKLEWGTVIPEAEAAGTDGDETAGARAPVPMLHVVFFAAVEIES
jgi:hypothetical protein